MTVDGGKLTILNIIAALNRFGDGFARGQPGAQKIEEQRTERRIGHILCRYRTDAGTGMRTSCPDGNR